MLVFSRKRGEAVAVGEGEGHSQLLKVTVLEIRQTQVKLGFEAPNDIPVHRWEVWQRINSQNGDLSKNAVPPSRPQDRREDDGGLSTRLTAGPSAPVR
jgi:carbon storage regulator